jgi:AcrR family transcriptional regulator
VTKPRAGKARSAHTIESITDVAVRVFLDQGYDGTSMQDLARAAGIRKASLYHHVRSKEELLRRGINRALTAYNAVLEELAAAPDIEPVERLRFVIRRTCAEVTEHVPETALMIRARGNTATELWAMDHRRQLNARVATVIADARAAVPDAPLDRDFDADSVARLILGMITSTVDWYRPELVVDGPRLARMVDEIVFGNVFSKP